MSELQAEVTTVDVSAASEIDVDASATIAAEPASKRARRAPRSETRIAEEAAFVLHGHPYKETSLIVDVLTRHHGRVALVARGAKRPRSALRGVLLAFQPLSIAWLQGRARSTSGAPGPSGWADCCRCAARR
jgi:DNA repair protein RecO (recombination protein O)